MTNVVFRWAGALVFLTACSAGEPSIKTNPEPNSSLARPGVWTAPVVSAVAASPSIALDPSAIAAAKPPSDEPLLQEFRELARKPATKSELEAFVSTHPRLIDASAHPYGPSIMWVLEYEEEEAALVLYRAGATTPPNALALAARGGLDAFIDAMLAKGADPNGSDDWGYTPLHLAAKYGNASTAKKLLAANAKPSVSSSNDGFTPLHIAVMEHKEELISILLKGRADLEAKDHHGRTPLHWGPFGYRPREMHIYAEIGEPHDTVYRDAGRARGIFLLLDAGAKIDATDDEGNTPLHEAALINSVRGAEALLDRGAKIHVKNKAGETPLSIAQAAKHRQPVLELLQRKR
jgi:Ankyrin repeats (3 copies)/Ankyrin repeats (many copies)